MKTCFLLVLLSCGVLPAQDSAPVQKRHSSQDEVTVQGCVGRSSGDYVLTKQDPAMTYELWPTGKTRLKNYLGQRVEVTGKESPTMSSSSDALNRTGSAASVTLTITSIKSVDSRCTIRQADQ